MLGEFRVDGVWYATEGFLELIVPLVGNVETATAISTLSVKAQSIRGR
jgi:hypothetical protein